MELSNREKAELTHKCLQRRKMQKEKHKQHDAQNFTFSAVERCKKLRHDRIK